MILTVGNVVGVGAQPALVVGGPNCLTDGSSSTYVQSVNLTNGNFTIDITGAWAPGSLTFTATGASAVEPGGTGNLTAFNIPLNLLGTSTLFTNDDGVTGVYNTSPGFDATTTFATSTSTRVYDRPTAASVAFHLNATDCATLAAAGGLTLSMIPIPVGTNDFRLYEFAATIVPDPPTGGYFTPPLHQRQRVW